MNKHHCSTFRIIDSDGYEFDVEKFIKSFENQYKLDIRTLPQWKEIVQSLYISTTDFKRKIQDVKLRKKIIIERLYTQMTRRSPFEQTFDLARTYKKWQSLEIKHRKRKTYLNLEAQGNVSFNNGMSSITDTLHPNTEIVSHSEGNNILHEEPPLKANVEPEPNVEELTHLPLFFSTNRHKYLSPLGSKDGAMSYNSKQDTLKIEPEREVMEWLFYKQTSSLKCIPEKVIITNNTLTEQIVKFFIVNCTTKHLSLRFKSVTDDTRFETVKIHPETSKKLYPGIAIAFQIIFKLRPNESQEEFVSSLFFKVGYNSIKESSPEAFLVPLVTKFLESRAVDVTQTVYFTPKYSWHINGKCGYPTGMVKVSVNDNNNYHLHVSKRVVDFDKDSLKSSEIAIGPNTRSLVERENPNEVDIKSIEFSTSKTQLPVEIVKSESLKTIDYMGFIVDEIVDLALETFVFEYTYLDLGPHTKQNISVYFTEAEHIGYHQSYYDFNFCDPHTDKIIITKTVLLLSEVLPHPVQIYPEILDMSNSPITHGFCEDHITISNSHKVYNVSVKFKLTRKMRELFSITPLEGFVHPRSKADFVVRICSSEFRRKGFEELAHFTIKLILSGPESVYHNVPPLFYEIIAPCAFEFKTVYNENYFKEVSRNSL